jgi:putative tryptophan/tyrosine transport system substrate-binding protein
MNKKALSLALLCLCLAVPACRKHEPGPAGTGAPGPYVIGIFQSVDSPTANEVRRGILQAFADAGLRDGREIVVTIRIANNDIAEVQRIARELAAGRVDMIIPLSTQALQAAILASRGTPIVFGAVAAPYLVGAGKSAGNHLGNVTGVVSTGPVRQTMALIREVLPNARRVGSIWTSSEINSEFYLDLARAAAAELGFELVAVPVTGSPELPRALQRLFNEKIDALFPMSDNTLNSSFDVIGRAADENAIPLFASFLRSVEFGACAALGFDFYDMGIKTGELAVRVKNGESPGRIPIQSMGEVKLYVNPAAAARQGVILPKRILDRAARSVSLRPGAGSAPGPVLD